MGRPIPSWIVGLLISQLALEGEGRAAMMCALLFDSLLRISEACTLTANDYRELPCRTKGVIALSSTKTGAASVVINDPKLHRLLFRLKMETPRHEAASRPLLGLTVARFSALLKNALHTLKFDDMGYTPHSFRHGGATHLRLLDPPTPIQDIMVIGRWRSAAFLTYITEVEVALHHDEGLLASRSDALIKAGLLYFKERCTILNAALFLN